MYEKAFVEFYETYLPSPAGADVVSKLEATKDKDEYCAVAVEAGRTAGYEFMRDEVLTVMKASEAKMKKALAAASGELSEEQLDTAVGGAMMTGYSPLTVNLLGPLHIRSSSPFGGASGHDDPPAPLDRAGFTHVAMGHGEPSWVVFWQGKA